MASNAQTNVTSNHDLIQKWAEKRGGQPACVKGTGGKGDVGMLRIDFPGYSGEESLQHIGWEDWFEKFDERGLALLYQEKTAGGAESNFNKLVSRETAEAVTQGNESERRSTGRASSHRSDSSTSKRPAKKTSSSSAGRRKSR